jgi:hypothetical protein
VPIIAPMPLLPLVTREQLPDDLRALWDDCERLELADALSPRVGQLLELERTSPVEARQYELGIVVVSTLTRCAY